MLDYSRVLLPVFKFEGVPSLVDYLPLLFDELFFGVASYHYEEVHEPVEGEQAHFVELHLSELLQPFQILI